MKKLFAMFVLAGMVAFVACGPSAEEKAKKAAEDSARIADSLANVAAMQQKIDDSIAQANAAAAHADSIAKGLIKEKKVK
jgi:hypothetical protein